LLLGLDDAGIGQNDGKIEPPSHLQQSCAWPVQWPDNIGGGFHRLAIPMHSRRAC